MKKLQRLSLFLALATLLASTGAAQTIGTKPAPGTEPDGDLTTPDAGAGGTYTGPGDTTPEGPTGGNGPGQPGSPSGPIAGAPGPVGVAAPTYAPGANPFAPNLPPPGIDYPGSPGNAPATVTPASRPSTEMPNSWQLWWHYNRWAHLKAAPGLAASGTGGFYIGRGQTQQVSPQLRASRAQKQDVVQPALLQALELGGRPEYQIYVLHALAKLRDIEPDELLGGFLDAVKDSLQSGNQNVSEKAVLALGIRGDDRYATWMTSILNDTPEGRALVGRQRVGLRLRTFAAYGLGLLGERTRDPAVRVLIYDNLVEALWLERIEVQAACLLALGLTPMPVETEYVDQSELFAGRTRVDQVLEIINFFDDPEQPFVSRSQAPAAIARLLVGAPESLRGRAVYAFLVASGQHSKELREVQNAAVIALGQIGRSGGDAVDDQVLEHLERIAYKSSSDRSTRYFATAAFAEAASRRGSGDEPFGAIPGVRKTLLQNLGRSRGEAQAWTALALGILEENAAERGELPSPDSGKALRRVLERTRSHEVAGALAIALGMMRDVESEELLRERMLASGEERVRGYTALALGMIGSPGASRDIERILTASTMKPFVIENAAIALVLLGNQEIGGRLFEILSTASRPKIQSSVASAMGWIKDPRPLGSLCEQLTNTRKNDTGRAWTAVAIGRICDDDEWPWVGRVSAHAQYDLWLPTLIEPSLQNGLLDLP